MHLTINLVEEELKIESNNKNHAFKATDDDGIGYVKKP